MEEIRIKHTILIANREGKSLSENLLKWNKEEGLKNMN
jgi:hypothetical protein